MRVLITGNSGFVGSTLESKLQQSRAEIFSISRDLTIKNHTKQQVSVSELNDAPIDVIYHCAASHPAISKYEIDIYEGNVLFSQKIIDVAEKTNAKVFVFCSTISIYGTHRPGLLELSSEIIEPSAYGKSKKTVENILIDWAKNHTCNYHIVRLPGIIGRGAHQTFLGKLTKCLLTNNSLTINHPESLYNHGVLIDDLCNFLISLGNMTSQSSLCQLGSDNPVTLNRIVEILSNSLNKRSKNIRFSDTLSGPIDISDAKELGYKSVSTETLIQKFLNTQRNSC